MNCLLSVIIPTKDRYETLIPLIKALEIFCTEEMEIIVQDNSMDNSPFLYVQNDFDSNKVRYYYDSGWRSVGDNFDLAINHSNGEYIIAIGDDDAVASQILEVTKWMKENDIESCSCNYSLYRWPTAQFGNKASLEYVFESELCKIPNLERQLDKIFKGGVQNKINLPGVYHGIVKRTLLDEVYNKSGSYFPGPSPDMANAIAISLFVKKHVVINIPFIIDGYSKSSTGHLTEKKKHIGKLEEQAFLPKNTVELWDERLPKIWLPNTIWPQSAIAAMINCDQEKMIDDINFDAIYIKIRVMYRECRDVCNNYIRKYSRRTNLMYTYLSIMFSVLKKKIQNIKRKKKIVYYESMEVEEAIEKTSEIIEDFGMINELWKINNLFD